MAANPLALIAGLGLQAVGTGMEAYGVAQAAGASSSLFEFQADLKRRQAKFTRKVSLQEQRVRRETAREVIEARRAGIAKAGFTLEGTPFETQLRTAEILTEEIGKIERAFELQALGLETEADIDKFRAKSTRRAGKTAVAATLLGGSGQTITSFLSATR